MNICKTENIVEYSDVERIATTLAKRGIKPTMILVRSKLGGGNLRDIAPLLECWKKDHEDELTFLETFSENEGRVVFEGNEQKAILEEERKALVAIRAQIKTAEDCFNELEQQLVAIQSKLVAVEEIWSEADALRKENRELAIGKAMAETMVVSLREQLAKAEGAGRTSRE